MKLELLREQLQENLITYLDGLDEDLIAGVCQVVVNTFSEYCLECGVYDPMGESVWHKNTCSVSKGE
jgi:hypothetical protein